MKIDEHLIKKVLEKLYQDHFPYSVRVSTLQDELQIDPHSIAAALYYLKDKGLVENSEDGWRINALGIDSLQGISLIQVVSPMRR